jgi:predicted transcriptional regulator
MNLNVNQNTQESRVLSALMDGRRLTAKQIAAQFSVGNPAAVIQNLRFKGYSIYLNTHKDSKGRVTQKYTLSTPSRKVIAAGYRALAAGTVAA